jgi:archaellum component FlaC
MLFLSRPDMKNPKSFDMITGMKISGTVHTSRSNFWSLLLLIVVLLSTCIYWFQHSSCNDIVTYHIGTIDPRFGLSETEVAEAISTAVSVWNKASNRKLFREEPQGSVEIDFVYDYRQAAADKLRKMSGNIDNTKGSYDALKSHIESLDAEYKEKEADYTRDLASYNERLNALNARINTVSKNGGSSEGDYQWMKTEKESLDSLHNDLKLHAEELKNIIDNLNSMVVVINGIASNLNLDVLNYNNTGEVLGKEFNEGLYEKRNNHETITIYHFNNHDRLVRVLAHELGHALGLEHNNNPQALMYRLNQSESLTLAPEDIAALKARCTR